VQGDSTLLDQRRDRLQYKCQQNEFVQGLESWYQGERMQGGVGACAFSRTTYLPNTIKIQPVNIENLCYNSDVAKWRESRKQAMSI